MGWEERPGDKREWKTELARRAAALFEEASTVHRVVISDAPGRISDESKIIAEMAGYAIVSCREDSKGEVENWLSFFEGIAVPVICVAISRSTGTSCVQKNDVIEATLVGLNRRPSINEAILNLALLIKERLGL
jgi:hypothetical protein